MTGQGGPEDPEMWDRMAARGGTASRARKAAAPGSVIFGALGRRSCDELVNEPKQGALTGAPVEAGSIKEDDLVPARPASRMASRFT
jgi:hypothetical protein